MFTGIIEQTGVIRELRRSAEGSWLGIAAKGVAEGMRIGDSVAVNGVCLTARVVSDDGFGCDLSQETLNRTSLGRLPAGTPVNLERPLAVGERLGGHFVLGHVDGIGEVVTTEPSGLGCTMTLRFPRELERYLVYKGSIAVDGISLTIASLKEDCFTVAIIPHTLEVTNLRSLRAGDPVNLEADILGKYFERFFRLGLLEEKPSKITFEYLKEQGF